jgi:antitoxin (DNA-binding transcriptional repressor) of toxin-antitoxin stability system
MEITTKQLRIQPEKILAHVNKGHEITLTHQGKVFAKIVPCNAENSQPNVDNELFGLWKDHDDIDDVDQYVRKMRRGRNLC